MLLEKKRTVGRINESFVDKIIKNAKKPKTLLTNSLYKNYSDMTKVKNNLIRNSIESINIKTSKINQ